MKISQTVNEPKPTQEFVAMGGNSITTSELSYF